MKQHFVVETVANNNYDDATVLLKHIGKCVAKFWETYAFFGTVLGVYNCKEMDERLWEI